MQSRLIVNILLLVLVAILGTAVFYSNSDDTELADKLTTIDPDSITDISIQHKNRFVTLEKSDKHWNLTRPVNVAANNFRVTSLLHILKTPSRASYEINELSLENVELDNAKTILTLNNIKIIFGIANPINNYRYIILDNKVHLIDDLFYPLISSQIGTLVSFNPLPENSEITKLVLPEQTLEIDHSGLWKSSAEISADAIVETINNWKHDQAFGVHSYFKRDSLGRIEIHLKNTDKPIVFEITDIDPWLIIARPELDLEYHFNLEFYDRLLRPGYDKQLPTELVD